MAGIYGQTEPNANGTYRSADDKYGGHATATLEQPASAATFGPPFLPS
jgi:hypothetical protein